MRLSIIADCMIKKQIIGNGAKIFSGGMSISAKSITMQGYGVTNWYIVHISKKMVAVIVSIVLKE